ncbi:hypothetical protein BDZ45DRAFT_748770 [Acephala macrosclerotiorum]|nr:hypothetical protein BDZ45DRAFT_748770 [Acephala macrosclerotiorum]
MIWEAPSEEFNPPHSTLEHGPLDAARAFSPSAGQRGVMAFKDAETLAVAILRLEQKMMVWRSGKAIDKAG